jgi:hypothetical protein
MSLKYLDSNDQEILSGLLSTGNTEEELKERMKFLH